jgi:hypothetical protein
MFVKFNAKRLLSVNDGAIILKPGMNDLSSDVVAQMQEDEILCAKFDSGELEIVQPSVKAKNGKKPKGVAALLAAPEGEAKELAAQTVDVEILKEWKKKEPRKSVRLVLQSMLKKISDVKFRGDEENKGSKYEGKGDDASADAGDEE